MRKLLLILCALAFLLDAAPRTVHIFHTADIHGHLNPDADGNGGWLKLSTLIQRLRHQVGPQNSLLIDCGDTVQGTVAASLSQGMVGIPPLRHLQYDAWIPGNHELDFGIPRFLHFMELTKDIAICGNLTISGHAPYIPWKLFTRNGLRIALIGINSSFLKHWQLPQDEHLLIITPARQLLPGLLQEILPQKPHIIILAAHQGWFRGHDPRQANELNDIAREFPEIDLILGAHTHRLVPGTLIGQRSWYTQPGAHASHLAHITVTVDPDSTHPPTISSRTIPVTEDIPIDQSLARKMAPYSLMEEQELKRPLKGFLARTARARGTPGRSCATSELIAMALAEQTGATVVFHGRLTNRDLPAGPLTAKNLYDIIPYDNLVVTAMLTAQEIQTILDEQLDWRKSYSFNGIYGIHTLLDGHGRIVLDPQDQNLPTDPEQRIKTAFNSHAAAGSGRFLNLRAILAQPQTQTRKYDINTRDAVEDFLARHPGFTVTPTPWLAK